VRTSWDRARNLLVFSQYYLELVMTSDLITFKKFVTLNIKFCSSRV